MDPVEVGGALLVLRRATEEHQLAVGRELWVILAVHLPWCDLMSILGRANRLDEHSKSNPAIPNEDQHLPIRRERRITVEKRRGELGIDIGDLVRIAPVEPDDPVPFDPTASRTSGPSCPS